MVRYINKLQTSLFWAILILATVIGFSVISVNSMKKSISNKSSNWEALIAMDSLSQLKSKAHTLKMIIEGSDTLTEVQKELIIKIDTTNFYIRPKKGK